MQQTWTSLQAAVDAPNKRAPHYKKIASILGVTKFNSRRYIGSQAPVEAPNNRAPHYKAHYIKMLKYFLELHTQCKRIEKRVFPKHESMCDTFDKEISKTNTQLAYAKVAKEVIGYSMCVCVYVCVCVCVCVYVCVCVSYHDAPPHTRTHKQVHRIRERRRHRQDNQAVCIARAPPQRRRCSTSGHELGAFGRAAGLLSAIACLRSGVRGAKANACHSTN